MNLEKIEGLIKLVEASSLTQFTYKEGDIKISMSKLDNPPVIAGGAAPVIAAPAPQAAPAPAARPSPDPSTDDRHGIAAIRAADPS